MIYKQYVIVAWVDPDSPNRSAKSPNYTTPMPTLKSMEQSISFGVTSGGQTFEICTYVDPLTPPPHKGCSIAVLRTDYKNSAKKKGLLIKCWVCLPDSNDVYTDEYLDNLLASWMGAGSVEILEYLWVPGTNTPTTSSILTLAEHALQLA